MSLLLAATRDIDRHATLAQGAAPQDPCSSNPGTKAMNGALERAARPAFDDVAAAYPDHSLSAAGLFDEIGIGLRPGDPAYRNTCAIRMSYALAKAGVVLKQSGPRTGKGCHQNMPIEASMRKLAEHLVGLWGIPEKFDADATAVAALAMRKGIVVFFCGDFIRPVGAQGHIDLLRQHQSVLKACAGTCFFGPGSKVWFWELT
jgi:2,3-bisphosphoglycerate-independent phosphoglycerate mutase